MNKELFVSSTPHETKVGLVEDDLLAEIYLERENEYTLAGSIYKGRVTRVLPGMQSAFVDIGLERDAFLYVSDFMELEEHDEDVTDVVPAGRGVQDMRSQSGGDEGGTSSSMQAEEGTEGGESTAKFEGASSGQLAGAEEPGRNRRWLRFRRTLPVEESLKIANEEAGVVAGAGVADVAMDAGMGATADRSRAWRRQQ